MSNLCTHNDLMALEFEPVPEFQSEAGKEKIISTLKSLERSSHFAFGVLRKTKAELIESYKKLIAEHPGEEKELMMCLPNDLSEAKDLVDALSELIESAEIRVLCALANCCDDEENADEARAS